MDVAVGCATLGIPASLYVQSQKEKCILVRKKPSMSSRRKLESEIAYSLRQSAHALEIEEWEAQETARSWVVKQKLQYDDLKNLGLEHRQLDDDFKSWVDTSCYKQMVPQEHCVEVLSRLEQLYSDGIFGPHHNSTIGSQKQRGSRDLFGHLQLLKDRVPSYKRHCSNLFQSSEPGLDSHSLFN